MNIIYLKQSNGKKLFSFNRHDYIAGENGTFIDGGFDYTRYNGELGEDTIENLIGDIRQQFVWGANYEKDGKTLREKTVYNHLQDLDTDHVISILIFFTNRIKDDTVMTRQWKIFHLIFLNELKYRYENNKY